MGKVKAGGIRLYLNLGKKMDRALDTQFMSVVLSTLSKILCKWKQDSVISFFLYLDSAFKYKHKLVHNQSPV